MKKQLENILKTRADSFAKQDLAIFSASLDKLIANKIKIYKDDGFEFTTTGDEYFHYTYNI